ncbi:hypothetical protein CXF85_22130 [Colwellia sp. 75C3]|uniref:hypothetical protein n=1 Tax=Colwellia sp. 75C3 TaxID=888425 RepID=UPI000C3376EC|nr:hypothetical protein [Colwellia sp. 75C3]PKG80808.1 hypothetical protein CXF85_22130 [Colwellia sp. 75C3]
MRIAELRNHPFLLLVLKDGESEGYFSPELVHKIKQQLVDMSLRIASDNLSIIYADQINKGCEIVLGITNLGLLDLCDNDADKAKEIIKTQGIVYCFRAGWAKYAQLKKISPSYFESISITTYALAISDTSDIRVLHASLMKEGYKSAKLLDVYKNIAASYCASTILVDNDEDVLLYELQRFLNTAMALLLIDSDRKMFTSSLYQEFNTYLISTDKDVLLEKIETCIVKLTGQLSVLTKSYLQEIALLDFSEFKNIIAQQIDVAIHIQEILELPITIANELHDDFEGGYDFHADDEDDLAYLMPDDR